MEISETIAERIRQAGGSFLANDNISQYLHDGELELLQGEVEHRVEQLLRSLVIDTKADHNTADTARRVAKMWVREVFSGRYLPRPSVTAFPNVQDADQCYVVGPVNIRSCCAHHMVPIRGKCWIGVIPDPDRLIGLSKHHRLVDWIMARPQIQEESAEQLANEIQDAIGEPRGIALVIRANHLCAAWRGVKDDDSLMTTSVMRGLFKSDHKARAEFLDLIGGMGYR